MNNLPARMYIILEYYRLAARAIVPDDGMEVWRWSDSFPPKDIRSRLSILVDIFVYLFAQYNFISSLKLKRENT